MSEANYEMLKDKRATRGKRMADLVGQAAEDDDAFWGHEIWQEDADASDAESYSTEEEKPDVFDSDFNDTEDDGDDDDDEGSGSDREASNKRANRYKDPSQTKKRPAPTHSVATGGETDGGVEKPPKIAKPRQPRMPFDESEIGPRTLRQSTKSKTIEADLARIKKASEVRVKPRVERIKPQFTQEEMLQEALRTEEENARWLAARKYQQKEKDAADRLRMKTSIAGHKDFIRYHSSKDGMKTITFSSLDILPSFFNSEPPPLPQKLCVITGLPAKYKDPRTGLPYANKEAFVELRKRHDQMLL